MASPGFDQAACDRLAECVREIEAQTDAEIVIVVRARSGSYRAADYLFGAILSFAGLLFLLYSPFDFHLYWVAIDVALLFGLGVFISSRSDTLRRLLTTEKHRSNVVRTYASAMFYEAGIANTQAEMGVLIYLSLLERRLETIADRGVLKAAPPMEWNRHLSGLAEAGRKPELNRLISSLKSLGALLSQHLPATGENPNELPDMPRFDLK
jgi:putative membrane protein